MSHLEPKPAWSALVGWSARTVCGVISSQPCGRWHAEAPGGLSTNSRAWCEPGAASCNCLAAWMTMRCPGVCWKQHWQGRGMTASQPVTARWPGRRFSERTPLDWQKVEAYLSEHSGARFSHSICPDCYEKIVKPELEQYQRARSEL